MTRDERQIGFSIVFLLLNVVYYTALVMGLFRTEFSTLYYIAYVALHLANFLTDGFSVGVVYTQWREARKFRKSMDKELA